MPRPKARLIDLMLVTAIVAVALTLAMPRVTLFDTERRMLGVPGRCVDVEWRLGRVSCLDLVGKGRRVEVITDLGTWRCALPW